MNIVFSLQVFYMYIVFIIKSLLMYLSRTIT